MEECKTKSIIITRPEHDASIAEKMVLSKGYIPLVSPMMEVLLRSSGWPELQKILLHNPKAFLITSANGVRALSEFCDRRDIPIVAVGESSASEAKKNGFINVASAEGNVEDLAQLICDNSEIYNGLLVHISGTITAGDLQETLRNHGFVVEKIVLYEAKAIHKFSEAAQKSILQGNVNGVLFYSPRTVDIFLECLRKEGNMQALENATAYCLSPAVADRVRAITWKHIYAAPHPTQNSLLALLE